MTRWLVPCALAVMAACGDPPVRVQRGEPVPIGDYSLTVRRTGTVPLTEDEIGLVVYVDLNVHDPRAPEQVHGTGFESLVSDPYHEHRERTLREGVEVVDVDGKAHGSNGYAREDYYRSEMARGAKEETFRRLAQEDYPRGYWEGERTERWALLFTVPAEAQGFALKVRNRDRREGQPAEALVPLDM